MLLYGIFSQLFISKLSLKFHKGKGIHAAQWFSIQHNIYSRTKKEGKEKKTMENIFSFSQIISIPTVAT